MKKSLQKFAVGSALSFAILAGGAIPAQAASIHQAPQNVAQQATVQSHDMSQLLTKSSSKKRRTTTGLNVRSNAGTKYKRIATLKKGTTVTVIRSKSGWSQVQFGKKKGWVSSKYLTTVKKAAAKKSTTKTASAKKTLTRYTKSSLNVRSNAGTKYKRVATLKKGAKVTVTRSKSGWSQIKSGKTTGWVSSKYLQSKKPAAPKKAAAKKSAKKAPAKKLTLRQVTSYSKAQQYLKQTCPKVKITRIKGTHSMYNPNTQTIMIASSHEKSSRLGWVFAHELMHHYQWHGKYKSNVKAWNSGIKGKKPVEIEADKMTYHMYGKTGQGHYSKSPASGKQLTNLKNIINKGKRAGC